VEAALIIALIVISIKIENINARVHKGLTGLECIRLIWNDYKWSVAFSNWVRVVWRVG